MNQNPDHYRLMDTDKLMELDESVLELPIVVKRVDTLNKVVDDKRKRIREQAEDIKEMREEIKEQKKLLDRQDEEIERYMKRIRVLEERQYLDRHFYDSKEIIADRERSIDRLTVHVETLGRDIERLETKVRVLDDAVDEANSLAEAERDERVSFEHQWNDYELVCERKKEFEPQRQQ